MRIDRPVFAGASSFAASLVLVLNTYWLVEGSGKWVVYGAVLVVGFLLGCALAFLLAQGLSVAVGVGSFLAILVLWMPVVLVTYGFALMALPLLAIYAAVVVLGFHAMGLARRRAPGGT